VFGRTCSLRFVSLLALLSAVTRRFAFVLAASLAVCVATPIRFAAAEAEPTVRLRYGLEGTASRCPTEEAFRRGVVERLGFDPFAEDRDTEVAVRIVREGPSLRASLRITNLTTGELVGVREIRGRGLECAELARTTTLAVTIAIDTMRESVAPESVPSAVPEPPLDPSRGEVVVALSATSPIEAVVDEHPSSEVPPEPPVEPWRIELGVGGGIEWGKLPTLSPLTSLRVGVARDLIALDAGLFVLPHSVFETNDATRVRSLAWGVRIGGCLRVAWFDACGSVAATHLLVRANTVDAPKDDARVLLSFGVLARARYEIYDAFELTLSAGADFPLLRPELNVNEQDVWRAPLIAPRAEIGALYRFR
jgi:hypothetical protein